MFKIYYLEKNNVPFYIGKSKNPIRRIHKHYENFGETIKLKIIDEVEDWKYWECYWIEQFRQWGFKLKNKNKGGGGPTKWTLEQKNRINPERIKKIKTHPTRGESISKTLIKRNHSKYYTKEVRNKISKKLKGIPRVFSKEHLTNLAEANLLSKGKVVECYDLEENFIKSFQCLREANFWLQNNCNSKSKNLDKQIKDCCNGRQKTCHGYKWRYSKI